MNDINLTLTQRTLEGKKLAKLRDSGYIPSVVYGANTQPTMTQSKVVETTKVAREAGLHTPVNLVIDGKKKLAIIKDIDTDPVKHQVRHIAFHTISQSDIITTEVPIVLTGKGESVAERAGLVVLQAIDTIEIKAKPANLPDSLEISIIGLETDEDRLTIADIKLPEGVKFADIDQDLSLVVANVYEPSALQAENEAAGGDAEDISEVKSDKGSEEATAEAPATTEAEKPESEPKK